MENITYSRYSGSLESIMREFVLHLKYTFGDNVKYVGTTTNPEVLRERIRDIDIMIVFSQLSESSISYVWRIINNLHVKYKIFLDARLYSEAQLNDPEILPVLNRYLLKEFLRDMLGMNPYSDYSLDRLEIENECCERIKEQSSKILAIMPRVADDSNQIRTVAQCVYDAIRAFLILENHPIARKEDACTYFASVYQRFSEASAIYEGYLDPESIVDVSSFILDSLAIVNHLLYRSQKKKLNDEILLINTPSSAISHPRSDYLSYDHNMPLGLVCIASHLQERGYKVSILDSYAENYGVLSSIDKIFASEMIPKIIGINSSSPNIHIVHKICSYLKRVDENIIIVCGGPHASLATEHTLSNGAIDFVVVGEGELPFTNLVQAIIDNNLEKTKTIPGVYYSVQGKTIGEQNTVTCDLREMPTPNFEYLPLVKYFNIKKRLYIHTSRGCGFNCIYCSVPQFGGKHVREVPIEILEKQLISIIGKYHPDEIQIVDDNFSHKKGKLIEGFCKIIFSNNFTFKWKCQVRADQITSTLVEQMKKAGCFEVDLGIESGNQEIQKYIRKSLDLVKTREVVESIHRNGIIAKAFFMLGFPDETIQQITDTINYAIDLKHEGLDDVAFFPVMPFPGTEISRTTGKEVFQGAIIDDVNIYERSFAAHRMRKYSARPEISLNSRFGPEELRVLVKFAYQQFSLDKKVKSFESEFSEYAIMEQKNMYAI